MAFKTRPTPEARPQGTFIDQGCELSGKLHFTESVYIDGKVDGEIYCEETVHVGESAVIGARIKAESLVIAGTVDGDIFATRKITLQKTASVSGEITTAGIVIEEGARFKGQIVIGGDEPPAAQAGATRTAPATASSSKTAQKATPSATTTPPAS